MMTLPLEGRFTRGRFRATFVSRGRQYPPAHAATGRRGIATKWYASGSQKADDGRGVRQAIADHHADRGVLGHPGGAQLVRDPVGVSGHLVAGEPAFFELQAGPVTVAGQPCCKRFGKAVGHVLIVVRGVAQLAFGYPSAVLEIAHRVVNYRPENHRPGCNLNARANRRKEN